MTPEGGPCRDGLQLWVNCHCVGGLEKGAELLRVCLGTDTLHPLPVRMHTQAAKQRAGALMGEVAARNARLALVQRRAASIAQLMRPAAPPRSRASCVLHVGDSTRSRHLG